MRPKPTWQPAKASQVLEQLVEWLNARGAAEPTKAELENSWAGAEQWSGEELLDRLVAVLGQADPQTQELITLCSHPRRGLNLPEFAWLNDEKLPALARNNLRLFYGRWLVQARLYDEGLAQLETLRPEDVADPAACCFISRWSTTGCSKKRQDYKLFRIYSNLDMKFRVVIRRWHV